MEGEWPNKVRCEAGCGLSIVGPLTGREHRKDKQTFRFNRALDAVEKITMSKIFSSQKEYCYKIVIAN